MSSIEDIAKRLGRRGGKATEALHGKKLYSKMGKNTRDRHGKAYYSKIGKISASKRWGRCVDINMDRTCPKNGLKYLAGGLCPCYRDKNV